MALVVVDNEGIIDQIPGVKDTPKAYPIVPIPFQTGGGYGGRIAAGFKVAQITGKYLWKFHRKKILGIFGLGGGLIAVTTFPSPKTYQNRQARDYMVKSAAKRKYSRFRKNINRCPVCC